METSFASFTPITLNPSPTKEEIRQFYDTYQEDTGSDFINNYLGLNTTSYKSTSSTSISSIPTEYNIAEILGSKYSPEPQTKPYVPKIPKVKNEITDEINGLNISDEDKEFLIKMAKAESGFNPYITNSLGYYGLYQFGGPALETVGMTKADFDDTKNQHKAALRLADINEHTNQHLFKKYVGTRKDGILITRNGLRAAHALLGAGGVREWLEGGTSTWTARHGHKDAYGTGPEKYLKLFV